MSSYAKVDVHTLYEMCNNYIEYYDRLQKEYDILKFRIGKRIVDDSEKDKLNELTYKILDLRHDDIKEIRNVVHLCYFILTTNKMGPLIEKITISDNIAIILNNFQQEVNKQNE
jgi:hypothetical protein